MYHTIMIKSIDSNIRPACFPSPVLCLSSVTLSKLLNKFIVSFYSLFKNFVCLFVYGCTGSSLFHRLFLVAASRGCSLVVV